MGTAALAPAAGSPVRREERTGVCSAGGLAGSGAGRQSSLTEHLCPLTSCSPVGSGCTSGPLEDFQEPGSASEPKDLQVIQRGARAQLSELSERVTQACGLQEREAQLLDTTRSGLVKQQEQLGLSCLNLLF